MILANQIICNHHHTQQCWEVAFTDVISQNGDRVLFETTHNPKATTQGHVEELLAKHSSSNNSSLLKPTLEDDTQSVWKQRATWESRAGVRDDTKPATEVEIASRKLVRAISKVDV